MYCEKCFWFSYCYAMSISNFFRLWLLPSTHISDETDFLYRFVQIIVVNTEYRITLNCVNFTLKNSQRALHTKLCTFNVYGLFKVYSMNIIQWIVIPFQKRIQKHSFSSLVGILYSMVFGQSYFIYINGLWSICKMNCIELIIFVFLVYWFI